MIRFEVGKSYSTWNHRTYIVTKRTEAFVTFSSVGGTEKIRRKPYIAVAGYEWVPIPYNNRISAMDAE